VDDAAADDGVGGVEVAQSIVADAGGIGVPDGQVGMRRSAWPDERQPRLSVTEPRRGLLAGDYMITRPDRTELTVPRRHDAQDSHLSPGARWLYDFWYDPCAMTVTDLSGPSPGALTTWPIPAGCATEPVSGRRPVWEGETHILLAVPYGTEAPAIRVDAETGAIERLRLDRHGRGEQGQYDDGTGFDVEGFVEPFR